MYFKADTNLNWKFGWIEAKNCIINGTAVVGQKHHQIIPFLYEQILIMEQGPIVRHKHHRVFDKFAVAFSRHWNTQ